ncbi:MAG: hypothetical protein IT445_12440 [Phycisphaeraceae bacterium]|nr:hypothetical protein [Phycisphaeraceae bacterium]
MKALWNAFLIVLFLHLATAVGFAGWLYSSGRLSKERLNAVVEMFKPTLEQEQALLEQQQAEAIEQQKQLETSQRLEAAKQGPLTPQERLTMLQESDERAQLRIDRLDRARQDIQGQIERAQNMLAQENQKLEAARTEFQQFINQRTEQLRDADFQKAVAMLEQQQPKQAKAMLQTLLVAGEQEKVVDYLAAMQERKAAKVLGEFKSADEVAQAAVLVEALRQRGVFDLPATADGATTTKGGST